MPQFELIVNWIVQHQSALGWVALFSSLAFLCSLVVMPFVVIHMPHDYFARQDRRDSRSNRYALIQVFFLIGKNVIGWLLLFAGLLMLFLPGPGLLSMLLGLVFATVPGKRRMIKKILGMAAVRTAIASMREKRNKLPLILD